MTRFEHYFKRDGNLEEAYIDYKNLTSNKLIINMSHYNAWLTGTYIEKPILDKVERKYLESFLKPFRDRVASITKCKDYTDDKERAFLVIELRSEEEDDDIFLPYFNAKTMYVGMEDGKGYSYEQLIEKNHL